MLRYFYIIFGWKHFKKVLMLLGALWIYQTFWVAQTPLAVQPNPNATQLTEADADYYQRTFDYVMSQPQAHAERAWQSTSGSGVIAAGERFQSVSGYECRPFRERYIIGQQRSEATGFGCKRQGIDGWCKLKEEHPKNCALEPPKTFFGRLKQAAHDDYTRSATAIKGTIDFW